jgi:hypothetical protein
MNDLYLFSGAYSFQGAVNPMLEAELKKCKTPEERESVIKAYQTVTFIGSVVAIGLGILLCGVIALFTD